jgi:1-acyl-sn-glycerol-3-phosphate acyltransferase
MMVFEPGMNEAAGGGSDGEPSRKTQSDTTKRHVSDREGSEGGNAQRGGADAGGEKAAAAASMGPGELPLINRVLFMIGWSLSHYAGTAFFRYRSFGAERVPMHGPLIVVSNHQSNLDPPYVGIALRRKHLNFIARVGLFKNPAFGWLIRTLNSIPVRRGETDLAAMKRSLQRLERGHAVMVFAEGARTLDGRMHEFQRGMTLLLKRAKCPVLPVAIDGAYEAWPRGKALPRLFGERLVVEVGEPIGYDELMAEGPEQALRTVAMRVDELRLKCRRRLRVMSRGAKPRDTAGDARTPVELWYTDDSPDRVHPGGN